MRKNREQAHSSLLIKLLLKSFKQKFFCSAASSLYMNIFYKNLNIQKHFTLPPPKLLFVLT